MKRYWARRLGIFGALLAVQAILWEYARMRPDYQFIVNPWSIRGYETVHGWVHLAIGVSALVAIFLVAWKGSENTAAAAGISLLMVAAAVVIAAFAGSDDYEITPGFPLVALASIVIGTILYRLSLRALGAWQQSRRFWFRSLALLVSIGVAAIVVNATIGGKELTFTPALGIGIAMFILALFAMSGEPRQLAANRMLMFSALAGAFAITVSAGAVRSTLRRLQVETSGISAEYLDTQVTWGHLMGVFGLILVFIASVGLWARRRDTIITAQRARRQREAAEASAAEIRAAQERIDAMQGSVLEAETG